MPSREEMLRLEPCPFCGESNAVICETAYLDARAFAVSCRTRDCHGAIFSLGYELFASEQEAIAAWNTRASRPASDEDEVEVVARAIRATRYSPVLWTKRELAKKNAEPLTEAQLEAARAARAALSALPSRAAVEQGAAAERAAIVAWLREQPKMVPLSPKHVRANSPHSLADAIKRGDHLPKGNGE